MLTAAMLTNSAFYCKLCEVKKKSLLTVQAENKAFLNLSDLASECEKCCERLVKRTTNAQLFLYASSSQQ